MTILENINDKKENIKNEILINNEIDKFNKVLDKFKNNEIKELIIKGKEKRKDRKHSKEKKKKESKKDDKKDYEELIKTYENKFKSTFEKVLSKNLEKCKQKLMEKAMGKTKKIVEELISNKRKASNCIDDEILHLCVTCDGCGKKPLKGIRYKCAVCHDFDYCAKCEEKNKNSHPHPFIMIRKPERAPLTIQCMIREAMPLLQNNIPNNNEYKFEEIIPKNINKIEESPHFNNNINQSIIVDLKELSSECLTSSLEIKCKDDTKEMVKSIKMKNNGERSWPKPVYLTCIKEESGIYGPSSSIKLKVEKGKETNVEIKLNCKDVKEGSYVSVWQLQNDKKEFFGQKISLKITIEKEKPLEVKQEFINKGPSKENIFNNKIINNNKPLEIKQDFIQKSPINLIIPSVNNNINIINNNRNDDNEIYDSFVFQCQVEELKSAFDLKLFDDKSIKKAAKEAKGDVDKTLQLLYQNQKK